MNDYPHLDSDLRRFIRREIQKQMNVIMQGVTGMTDPETWVQDIEQPYPGADTITERPLMHPYGYYSYAPRGVFQVTARRGEHPSNLMVLGHQDSDRPTDAEEGEAGLYNKVSNLRSAILGTGIFVGKGSADKPLALGETLNEILGQMIDLFVAHVHPSPGAPANNIADWQSLKLQQIETKKILTTLDGGLA